MCKSFYDRLQQIWADIGCDVTVCNRELLLLEERCLAVYSDAVASAELWKTELQNSIVNAQEEMKHIEILLGLEPGNHKVPEDATLQEQEILLKEQLEVLQNKLESCKLEFAQVQNQISELESYLSESSEETQFEEDYRQEQLDNLQRRLVHLQELKERRGWETADAVNTVKHLCNMMAFSYEDIIGDVHPSLCSEGPPSVEVLHPTVQQKLYEILTNLEEEKKERVEKLSYLGASIVALCHVMDISPPKDQDDVTACIGASVNGNFQKGMLSDELLAKAKAEVERLEKEQVTKVEELVLKKMAKIEEICSAAHMEPQLEAPNKLVNDMKAGLLAPADLLSCMEEEISRASEAKMSRSEVLQLVERWQRCCTEVEWLEKFEQDETRFYSHRAYKDFGRAEKARKEHKKLPGLEKTLVTKVEEWEASRNEKFLYDGEYLIAKVGNEESLRAIREEERKKTLELSKEEKRRQLEDAAKFGTPRRLTPAGAKSTITTTPRNNANDRRSSMGGLTPVKQGRSHTKPIIGAPANVVVLSREGKERPCPLSPINQ